MTEQSPSYAAAGPGDQMRIWNLVEKTPVDRTKAFDNGRFKGTSINAQYLYQRATELWGPIGIGWGYTILHEELIDLTPILNADGATIAQQRIHNADVELWYLDPVTKAKGTVVGRGHTPVVHRTRKGEISVDWEYGKKTITDALTKALSLLGFGADIRLGMYDEQDYVQGLKDDKAIADAADQAAELLKQQADFSEWFIKLIGQIDTATKPREVQLIHDGALPRVTRQGNDKHKARLEEVRTQKLRALKEARQTAAVES